MAQKQDRSVKSVKVQYEYDGKYRLIAANGLYGGITPGGELKIDFFAEYTPAPKTSQLSVSEEGQVTEHKDTTPQIVRRIQMGMLVSPNHIQSFANWFQEKAEEMRKIRGQTDDHVQSE